jgi:membrane-associated phospholipid phosphatase
MTRRFTPCASGKHRVNDPGGLVAALGILLAAASAAGVGVWALARRVPAADPASPRAARIVARGVEHEVRTHDRVGTLLRERLDPRTATGLLLTAAVIVVTVLGILAVLVRSDSSLLDFDRSVQRWATSHTSDTVRDIIRGVTELGGTVGLTIIAVAVGIFELRRPPRRWLLPFLLVSIGGISLVTALVKLGVSRVRPELGQGLDASFPSGHSASAAAAFAAIALLVGRGRTPRVHAMLAGAAVAVAIAVGSSRVLLGVHWTTDVIAGLTLGWAWFAISSVAFGGRLLVFGTPVEAAARHDALVERAPPAPAGAPR